MLLLLVFPFLILVIFLMSLIWPVEGYEPGHSQPSFDKQFVRDWLKANPDSDYNLPQEVIDKTIAKYLEAYRLLTGTELEF